MKFLTGILTGTLLALIVIVTFMAIWAKNPTAIQELPPMQVYAGEPIAQPKNPKKPALYVCSTEDKSDGLFMVIAPSSGEFMLFDNNGGWVNNGQFFEAKTDRGTSYLHAEIGSNLIALSMDGDKRWHLVISNDAGTNDLICN